MLPLLIVSPHLDDAVLGCGQLMVGRPDCVVVTVFAGRPPAGTDATTYDVNCGFSTADEAWRRRRGEDSRALTLLGARPVHLPFVDHQYGGERPTASDVARAVADVAQSLQPEGILWPAGLGHPDHLLVAAAGRRHVDGAWPTALYVYEELPYRVLFPEQVPAALAEWGADFRQPPTFLGTGDLDAKDAALRCYHSQLWSLDERARLCPERFHRVA